MTSARYWNFSAGDFRRMTTDDTAQTAAPWSWSWSASPSGSPFASPIASSPAGAPSCAPMPAPVAGAAPSCFSWPSTWKNESSVMNSARSFGVPVGSRTPTTVQCSLCWWPPFSTPCVTWNVEPTFNPVRDAAMPPTTASNSPFDPNTRPPGDDALGERLAHARP